MSNSFSRKKIFSLVTHNLTVKSSSQVVNNPFRCAIISYCSRANMDLDCNFPTGALLPKKETGAAAFINKYPEYDGRGTIIAIFDSGVDPGAAGLQVTSDGKPKVVARYDCTGAGDIDTSTVVQSVDGVIEGITGRKLKIPKTWKNPSGNYHIGVKRIFEMYPKKVQERIVKERKEKLWDNDHKTALADATRNLNAIVKEQESNKSGVIPREDKLKKDEADAQVEVLNSLEKKHVDIGPTYDVVMFHDGDIWRACLDTSEVGELESCTLLGEYTKTQEFASISSSDKLNYSINVHEDGNVLEVVGLSSTHGTHVACIAAANFPDEPEKNGIAPGAQIVSLCIGDIRLEGMETGVGIVRSMIHVMNSCLSGENKIDVINMSYGEHPNFSNAGRLGELMAEVVDKYKVVWVASASNHGPALSTISAPPDVAINNIISVGAYVSPDMMEAEYSLRQKMPGMPYTWSSRGPTLDGDKGVTVCAPGGAITSVSNFTLRGCQLLNGTSMAAPHAAGCVSLLLSGLKAQGLPYTPFSVKRALENTAHYLENMDPFAQGNGLLQVEKAFDHLTAHHDAPERDVRFQVSCGPNNTKGIYLRTGVQEIPKDCSVTVEPVFADAENVASDRKIEFNMSLVLACSAPWVQHPSHLEVMNVARSISVRIDPAALSPGVNNTCLRAYDVKKPEKGPVFRVEITVVQPQTVSREHPELSITGDQFQPNTIRRHFILVPDEVTWAVFRIKSQERENTGRFIVHCTQLLPKRACTTVEYHKMINVSAQSETVCSFQVKGGVIMEVVVAKYWASLGSIKVDYKVEFHGCRLNSSSVTMVHADGIHEIELFSGLQNEELSPNIQIKNIVSVHRPTEAKVTVLSPRDVIPPSRQIYQLILTYNFHMNKTYDTTPFSSFLSHLLYESEFESQLWMLYDTNKQLMASGDAYPCKYNVKLEKGDYVIRHQIRHEKKEVLEKMTDLPFLLSHKLPSPISIDVYGGQNQAMLSEKKLTTAMLPAGKHSLPIYISPIQADKISKLAVSGHYLQGTISFAKEELGKKVDVYPFKYILTEPGKKSSKNNVDKNKKEEYEDSLRDVKVSWLSKQENREDAEKLYEQLLTEFNNHLSVHSAMLAHLEGEAREWPGQDKRVPRPVLERIQAVATKVIDSVDATELLAYLGTKSDQRPEAPKIKQAMDRQKTALVDALTRYGSVQCRLYAEVEADDNLVKPTLQDIDKTYLELLRFTDSVDKATGQFHVWHACVHQHYGRMLKSVHKLCEERSTKEMEEVTLWALRKLGWQHAANFLNTTAVSRYPPNYEIF